MLNFDSLDKGLWIVSAAHFVYYLSTKMFLKFYSINWPNFIAWLPLLLEIHFVYDFSTKMFLMLYSIKWPNFIAWLPLLLEILGNICVLQLFVNQVVMSWILKLTYQAVFSTWPKNQDKILKYLENKKSF